MLPSRLLASSKAGCICSMCDSLYIILEHKNRPLIRHIGEGVRIGHPADVYSRRHSMTCLNRYDRT